MSFLVILSPFDYAQGKLCRRVYFLILSPCLPSVALAKGGARRRVYMSFLAVLVISTAVEKSIGIPIFLSTFSP